MSEYGAFRFGWDGPARFTTTTQMLQEASELLPGEPLYAPIPFSATDGVSDTGMATTISGYPLWSKTPTRIDLLIYQGDDVVIPLFFNDPSVLGDDMEDTFSWFSQIRARHSFRSTLVADFSVKATYHPSGTGIDDPDVHDEYTKVELFLPRMFNNYSGFFEWEVYSLSSSDYARFPKPDGIDPLDWPPPDELRTWLYGVCSIVPRTTDTDYLPNGNGNGNGTTSLPPGSYGNQGVAAVLGNGGFFVIGPNGRVP